MLTQRNTRAIIAPLAISIVTTLLLQSTNENWQAVVASAQVPLAQKRSSVPTEEKYVTYLFNLSGKKLAEFEGEMHGFSSNRQRLLTESNFGTGRYYLFDVAGKKLLQFEGRLAEFSPNGQRVITMLRDKDYFQLYDAMGKKLAQLPGTVLKSPIFSQNSQRLVTFTENNAYLFNLTLHFSHS
jgi:hypothetical protein